jgi:hypothetical protein
MQQNLKNKRHLPVRGMIGRLLTYKEIKQQIVQARYNSRECTDFETLLMFNYPEKTQETPHDFYQIKNSYTNYMNYTTLGTDDKFSRTPGMSIFEGTFDSPLNNWGIVIDPKNGSQQWACCGLKEKSSGCWIALEKGQPIGEPRPYRILLKNYWMDLSDDKDPTIDLFKNDIQVGTAWKDQIKYELLHDEIFSLWTKDCAQIMLDAFLEHREEMDNNVADEKSINKNAETLITSDLNKFSKINRLLRLIYEFNKHTFDVDVLQINALFQLNEIETIWTEDKRGGLKSLTTPGLRLPNLPTNVVINNTKYTIFFDILDKMTEEINDYKRYLVVLFNKIINLDNSNLNIETIINNHNATYARRKDQLDEYIKQYNQLGKDGKTVLQNEIDRFVEQEQNIILLQKNINNVIGKIRKIDNKKLSDTNVFDEFKNFLAKEFNHALPEEDFTFVNEKDIVDNLSILRFDDDVKKLTLLLSDQTYQIDNLKIGFINDNNIKQNFEKTRDSIVAEKNSIETFLNNLETTFVLNDKPIQSGFQDRLNSLKKDSSTDFVGKQKRTINLLRMLYITGNSIYSDSVKQKVYDNIDFNTKITAINKNIKSSISASTQKLADLNREHKIAVDEYNKQQLLLKTNAEKSINVLVAYLNSLTFDKKDTTNIYKNIETHLEQMKNSLVNLEKYPPGKSIYDILMKCIGELENSNVKQEIFNAENEQKKRDAYINSWTTLFTEFTKNTKARIIVRIFELVTEYLNDMTKFTLETYTKNLENTISNIKNAANNLETPEQRKQKEDEESSKRSKEISIITGGNVIYTIELNPMPTWKKGIVEDASKKFTEIQKILQDAVFNNTSLENDQNNALADINVLFHKLNVVNNTEQQFFAEIAPRLLDLFINNKELDDLKNDAIKLRDGAVIEQNRIQIDTYLTFQKIENETEQNIQNWINSSFKEFKYNSSTYGKYLLEYIHNAGGNSDKQYLKDSGFFNKYQFRNETEWNKVFNNSYRNDQYIFIDYNGNDDVPALQTTWKLLYDFVLKKDKHSEYNVAKKAFEDSLVAYKNVLRDPKVEKIDASYILVTVTPTSEKGIMPEDGSSFHKNTFSWVNNSCWFDSVFATIFGYPDTTLSNTLLSIKNIKQITNTITFVNKSTETKTICKPEELITWHEMFTADILTVQNPPANTGVCPLKTNTLWLDTCGFNTRGYSNNAAFPVVAINRLLDLYEGINNIVKFTTDIDQKFTENVIVYEEESTTTFEGENGIEQIPASEIFTEKSIPNYTLTGLIYHTPGILGHFTAYVKNFIKDSNGKVSEKWYYVDPYSHACEEFDFQNLLNGSPKQGYPAYQIFFRNDEIEELKKRLKTPKPSVVPDNIENIVEFLINPTTSNELIELVYSGIMQCDDETFEPVSQVEAFIALFELGEYEKAEIVGNYMDKSVRDAILSICM